jgi:serine/threonine-protein kinase RIO1
MHKAGIPCPIPLEQKEHVLVMSFLGDNGWPSPQLREVKFSSSSSSSSSSSKKDTKTNSSSSSSSSKQKEVEHHWWSTAYRNVLLLVRDLYQKASLVHGDLSEYNIIWHHHQLYLIDVGQAVHQGHALADAFLARDLKQVHAFFRSKGVRVLGEGAGEGGGEGFVKMVYVERGEEEGEEERRGRVERWEVGRRDEEGEEREREAAREVLERLIEGREGWKEILKSVRGVFRDGARREGEEVGGRAGNDGEEEGDEEEDEEGEEEVSA